MSGIYGADVANLRQLSTQFDQAAERLNANRMTVGNAIQISAWVGPVAVRFRHQWDSEYSRMVQSAAERLRVAARSLRANADDQESTSAPSGGPDRSQPYQPYAIPEGLRVWEKSRVNDEIQRGAWSPAEIISEFDRGVYDSGVSIRTIAQADGTTAHIIYIPGTQDWWSQSDNVFDGVDNLAAMAGAATPAEKAVLEAMRQHGIGPDDPIMLAGHSQGALVAGNLASDPQFRDNYNVEGVLAYGATISDRSIPAEVAVTQIVNEADIVPHATDVGGPSGIENLNRIDVDYIDIQTPHAQDSSFFGRILNAAEVAGAVLTSGREEHVNHSGYAQQTWPWFDAHKDEWRSEYASFQTDADSRSSMTRYGFAE